MHPVICTIGPFTIYSYGLMLVAALIVASGLALSQAKKEGINPDVILNLLFGCMVSGIIGARIFFIIENFSFYRDDPLEMVMLQHGGLSWFGGFFLALLFAVVFLRKKKLGIYRVFDLIAPFLALAQAIGRIGCFLNGCCYGKTAQWFGIYSEEQGGLIIPTQLYSSLLLVFIFITLRILQARPHKAGSIFLSYLLLYSLKRFFIEFLRADNPAVFFSLSLFQIISAAIFFFSAIKLFLISRQKG